MKRGTKSILFGVHQFLWHPLTVLRAWRRLYGSWPRWPELIAILLHDVGYFGCPNMDGAEGKAHPHAGALLTAKIVVLIQHGYWPKTNAPIEPHYHGGPTYWFTVAHSRDAAKAVGIPPSKLYAADKVSIFFDPKWFYLLRARLSGEIAEFKHNAISKGYLLATATDSDWFDWYRESIRKRPGVKELL